MSSPTHLAAHHRAVPAPAHRLSARVAGLQRAFDQVWRTRMQGLPLLNPALWVEAVDFEAFGDGEAALGVLVTPWFMNLIRLPLAAPATGMPDDWPIGSMRAVDVGGETFDFIGAADPVLGPFAMCSLFSPMFEFSNQTAARATAQAVLLSLRGRAEAVAEMGSVGRVVAPSPVPRPAGGPAPATAARVDGPVVPVTPAAPARRAFLFGASCAAAPR